MEKALVEIRNAATGELLRRIGKVEYDQNFDTIEILVDRFTRKYWFQLQGWGQVEPRIFVTPIIDSQGRVDYFKVGDPCVVLHKGTETTGTIVSIRDDTVYFEVDGKKKWADLDTFIRWNSEGGRSV